MKGKTILITREKESAIKTAKVFLSFGARVRVCPLIEVKNLAFDASETIYNGGTILVTSQNAARILASYKSARQSKVVVIGQKSADMLSENGFKVISTFKTSDELLAELPKLQINSLIYFRGEDIANHLDRKLQDKGINLKQVICYKTEALSVSENFLDEVDIVTLYSPKTADIFIKFLNSYDVHNVIVAALSYNIAKKLEGYSFKQVLIADHPTEECLIEVICREAA